MKRPYRILGYHSVADHAFELPDGRGLPLGRFRAQLEYLITHKYEVVPLETMLYTVDQGMVPGQWISITFDRGFSDTYHSVFPMLRERGWPATVFVTTSSIGGSIEVGNRTLPALTRDQIVEMKRSGLVTFGTHGHQYRALVDLPEHEREEELTRSKATLEGIIEHAVDSVSYPLDQVDQKVVDSAAKAGYRWGVDGWTRLGHPLARRRIAIHTGDTPYHLSRKLSLLYFTMSYFLRR